MQSKPTIRCAIYTRKSNEEGLRQEFNSLDAQRFAGESYINSQKQEGWVLIPKYYDDGGYSGGNIERPALKQLMSDIKEGYVDCIVVYKIDRLTRSIKDFSKIIEILDEHRCSFVSVTQSFNTSDSMGRLMLNVVLSFAQYEREITSERIKDKLEASCKKGMFRGGKLPLGYESINRKLVINEHEAETVRIIFNQFCILQSVIGVVRFVKELGRAGKNKVLQNGQVIKGAPLTKRRIYRLLENPIYIGKLKLNGNLYEGNHQPIISDELWGRVQDTFKCRDKITKLGVRLTAAPLLKGIFRCGCCDCAMTPIYSSNKGGKRYGYYVCSKKQRGITESCMIGYVSSAEIENIVKDRLFEILKCPEIIASTIATAASKIPDDVIIAQMKNIAEVWAELFPQEQIRIIRLMVSQVIMHPDGVDIRLYSDGIKSLMQKLEAA